MCLNLHLTGECAQEQESAVRLKEEREARKAAKAAEKAAKEAAREAAKVDIFA